MTDTATAPGASNESQTAPAKPKTVLENMDSRRIFANVDEASAYLNERMESLADFGEHPLILKGVDEEGNFDPAIYNDSARVMVSVLANRGEKDAKGKAGPSTVRAIIVTPVPTLEAILNSEAAKTWADGILLKELNHVAVRQLRTADDVIDAADRMPLSLSDYIESGRDTSGGIMETFNSMFKGLNAGVAQKSPIWAKARLTKLELKRAFESRAYALEIYPQLEDRGEGKNGQPLPSLFVMALQLGSKAAKDEGLDPAIFDRWLATRNEKAMTKKIEDADAEFDLDDLAFVSDEKDSATVADTDTETAPTDGDTATDSTDTQPTE